MKKVKIILFLLMANLLANAAGLTHANSYGISDSEWQKYINKTNILLEQVDQWSFLNYVVVSGGGDFSDIKYFKNYVHGKLKKDKEVLVYRVGTGVIGDVVGVKTYFSSLQKVYSGYYKDYLKRKPQVMEAVKRLVEQRAPITDPTPTPFNCGSPCANPGFESGTGFWDYSSGTACSSSPDPCTIIAGFSSSAHVLETVGGFDPVVGGTILPLVAPGGGSSSLMIGNGTGTNYGASRASISFTVDPSSTNFTYRYAVVLQDPGTTHTDPERPYFKVKLRDAANNILPCGDYEVIAKPPIVGFTLVSGTSDVYYRQWTTVFVPLGAYVGQCVTLEFTSSDCSQGGHYGYAYIDADCSPSGLVTSSPAVCGGATITLSAPAGAASYSWVNTSAGGTTGIVGSSTTQTISVNAGGTYEVTMTSVTGTSCSSVLTINVPSNPSNPVANFSSTTVCAGVPTNFTDISTPVDSADAWAWDFNNDGIIDATTQNPTYTYATGGTYPVTLTISWGPCNASFTQNVTVLPSGVPVITPVSAVCSNASPFNLSASLSGGVWSGTGITDPSTGAFNPASGSATNTIIYTIPGSCAGSDTIQVTIIPFSTASWTPPTICGSNAPIDLNSLLTGTTGGTWSGTGVTGSMFDPSGLSGPIAITYSVGTPPCDASSTQNINVLPAANASFTATPTSGLSPVLVNFTNNSTGALTYVWNLGNGVTSTVLDPSTTYTGLGDYIVMLIANNGSGCNDTAYMTIHVDEFSHLTVPNIFTPNGDGHNDTFHAIIADAITSFHATVYDRWGLKMYDWTDEQAGWNGQAKNGSPAPDGTYYYIINGKGVDNKEYVYTGYLQLLREK